MKDEMSSDEDQSLDNNKESNEKDKNDKENKNEIIIKEENENEPKEIKEKNENKINSSNIIFEKKENLNLVKPKSEYDDSNSNFDIDISVEKEKELNDSRSTNNLDNLSILFKDYIHKFDIDKTQSRKRQRSIYRVSKSLKNEIIGDSIIGDNNKDDSINFYNIIKDKLNEVKQDTLFYLDQTKQKLEKKYNYYIVKISEFLVEKENQISKLLGNNDRNDNFINYANNNLFKQIDDILEIHGNIFSALEDHFNLLYSFLEQYSLIQQKKPIEYFINNNSSDILNCWFLNKIDFNQINLTSIISNKELSDLCVGYLSKMNNKICPIITIEKDKDGNLPVETDILYKNLNKLNKIKFVGLSKENVSNLLKDIQKSKKKINISEKNGNDPPNAKKLKSLSIIDSNFNIDKLPKLNFPALKKFKLKKSFITISYLFDSIFGDTNALIQIYIENINMTDNSLKLFFEYLAPKKSIQETLKHLSFKGNNLTKINFNNYGMKANQLKNLQYLNFSKNNIFEFSTDNFKIFPELKVLDLTDNNISNYLLFESIESQKKVIKFIALLSNNIFIHNNRENNKRYIKYFADKLSSFQHKIKKISFALLFNKDNLEYFSKLKISPAVKISIYKLDLSFCGLIDEDMWKFFRNNFGLLNLYDLNLSNNSLTNNLFNLCSGIQGDILLEKLEMIDLSGNKMECSNIKDLKGLDTFVDNHKELKKIKLQQTNFIAGLNKLIKNENKDEINNILQRLIEKNIKFVIGEECNNPKNYKEYLYNLLEFKNKSY